jgi:hypothetical protein
MQANVSIPPCLFEKPDGEVVKPFMAQPRQVLEAFMKEDVNALSPAEARSWMKRLIDARARIPEDFPQTEALEAVFQECIRACMERLGRIEPQDGDGRSEHPSGSDHPS